MAREVEASIFDPVINKAAGRFFCEPQHALARMILRKFKIVLALALGVLGAVSLEAADASGVREFRKTIKPLLEKYCYDCHGDGSDKGSVTFDTFATEQALLDEHDLWLRALKNVRAGLMPPPKKPQPTAQEKELLDRWIKQAVFSADPKNPDPGRVTLRRLNRVEYQNTVRDLIGVNFDTQTAFPPDDTGHGFDNIGDVLTLPPMLLEKYVQAANKIIGEAVPAASRVMRERLVAGRDFQGSTPGGGESRGRRPGALALSYYQPATVSNVFKAQFDGKYTLNLSLMVNERYVDNVFDYNKCKLIFRVDGKELLGEEYTWQGGKPYQYNFDVDWTKGDHQLSFELQPLTPDEPQTRSLSLQISSVNVQGPQSPENWVRPQNYEKYFPKEVPGDEAGRRAYARELLGQFARRAFRRPVEPGTLDRLTSLAESVYSQPGKTFEAGVSQGMVAVLASPRFLFREERPEKAGAKGYANVDAWSLASRLSYFLWSSMPDDELFKQAEAGTLRQNLTAQVERMLKDKRSDAFVKNFVGQWLRSRDIENVPIEARFVLAREEKFDAEQVAMRKRSRELSEKPEDKLTAAEREELRTLRSTLRGRNNRPLRAEMDGELRTAMRRETEKYFDYLLREDRSLLELIESDYTFLNERLAKHYGVPGVDGEEMRLVKLSADSPRGGILTQGTILGVTSNPTRTSPVKRGLFILENILGSPPPPPPPNVPPLEDASKGVTNRALTLRETMAVHAASPLCNSCHNRMDPLGLAMENFNAMGMWRDGEYGEPIDATGRLISGEEFKSVKELKKILARDHAKEFYQTVTEKLLTYALGRGVEYYDVPSVDGIVARLEAAKGKPSALIAGVIESAPFLKMRTNLEPEPGKAAKPVQQRADAGIKP